MGEQELERVMLRFIRDEADVLVCTTIIENGLDIPRANTLLVNRADRFGLSELYQLRGRVGRSNQRAYAYLMIPPGGDLTPLARRRLAALREFSDLGAGFRIAALDLELRGRRQPAGARAARAHRVGRLRSLLPNAGARRIEQEGRSARPSCAPRSISDSIFAFPRNTSREKTCVCARTSGSPG